MLTSSKALESANEGGVTDWDKVKRAVAASEPPRIQDIISHSKFLQRYAGPKHSYMKSTLEYLDLAMPEGRIVSGNFFEKLAGLKCPPTEMIPRLMHACVITQACGDKHRENVGATITESQLKSLHTTNRAIALSAEMTIVKGFELASKANHLPIATKVKALGELQRDLVLLVLDIQESGKEYETIDDVSKVFLGKLLDPRTSSITTEGVASPQATTTITYTEDGHNAGRLTVTNLGFKPKDIIEPKKSTEGCDEQYEIQYINDDGSAGVSRINPFGTVTVNVPLKHLQMNQLVNDYRAAKHKIELYEDYPDNKASESDAFTHALQRGAVVFAMHRLQTEKKYPTCTFSLQKHPTSRVFLGGSESTHKANKLRVVPLSHKFGEPLQRGSEGQLHVVADGVKLPITRNVSDKSISEFFVMRTVYEKKFANMELEWFEVTVKVDTDKSVLVKVPCAVNFKAIEPNDELVLFKTSPKKVEKDKVTMVNLEPQAKKHKTD